MTKKRDDRYSAPKYGAPPKKGVGGNGFRQARENHRSGTDAAGESGARARARAARESAGITPGSSGISWTNGTITINGMRLGPGQGLFVPSFTWDVAEPTAALPVEHTVDAVQAWKVARLYTPDGRALELGAVMQAVVHPVEGSAQCRVDLRNAFLQFTRAEEGHASPDLSCSCGYYAWKTRAEASQYIKESANNAFYVGTVPLVLMQVELFGRVIQFEHGYRAQSQRVLGVVLPSTCSALLCGKPAVVVDFPTWGRDAAHRVLCAQHRDVAAITAVGIADVANALGCEVTWASA